MTSDAPADVTQTPALPDEAPLDESAVVTPKSSRSAVQDEDAMPHALQHLAPFFGLQRHPIDVADPTDDDPNVHLNEIFL